MITFGIVTVGLIIVWWILGLYALWSQETNTLTSVDTHDIARASRWIRRLTRKAWFRILRITHQGSVWCGSHISRLFFTLFPKARHAFEKKDELTGLSHGPSSYFLLSISESKESPQKKTRQRKKIV